MADHTPETLYRLYMGILGRGLYTPGVLFSRLRRHLRKTLGDKANDLLLESSNDFKRLSPEAVTAAAEYLGSDHYKGEIDTDRAARSVKRSA